MPAGQPSPPRLKRLMQPPSRPLRILFLAGQLGLGGAERQLYYLSMGLDRQQFTAHILTLNPGGGDYWETPLREAGIPVTGVPRAHTGRRIFSIRRFIRQWRPDLIHVFHFFANAYGVLARWPGRTPLLGSIRFWPTQERIERIPFAPWRWLCLRGVDALICNSQTAVTTLQQHYNKLPPLYAIPNGVPLPADAAPERRAAAWEQLGRRPGELWLGYTGWLNENKNVSLLLRALARLQPALPQLRLALVGDGPLRAQLEAEAQALGLADCTTFYGQLPQAEAIMPAFDVICLPSHSEGMPNVLMEAAAAGVPAVATNVGGVAEVVRDGETGFLVPAGDEDQLVGCLNCLLTNEALRQQMGAAAQRFARDHLSIPRMVAQYQTLYMAQVGR